MHTQRFHKNTTLEAITCAKAWNGADHAGPVSVSSYELWSGWRVWFSWFPLAISICLLFLKVSLIPEGKDLMGTVHFGVSVSRFLTLFITSGCSFFLYILYINIWNNNSNCLTLPQLSSFLRGNKEKINFSQCIQLLLFT